MPSASATAFIVEAVPMVLQCPADGAEAQANSMNSSYVISPAASFRRARQITVPDPANAPSCQPSSMGPLESTIAGMSTADAARSEEHTSELQSRLHLVCR